MNIPFEGSDLEFDKYFGEYYSVSVLHALFDGYLPPNFGSFPKESMSYFDIMLSDSKFVDSQAKKNSFAIVRKNGSYVRM